MINYLPIIQKKLAHIRT